MKQMKNWLTSSPKPFSTSLWFSNLDDERLVRITKWSGGQWESSMMFLRDLYPDRFHWDYGIRIQSLEFCGRGNNPWAIVIDIPALNILESFEHVKVPLTKLVDPAWDKIKTVCVLDNPIELMLQGNYVSQTEITLVIPDSEWRIQSRICLTILL